MDLPHVGRLMIMQNMEKGKKPVFTWFTPVALGLGVLFLYLSRPAVIIDRKKPDQTEAVNNARQMGFALHEFETEYGRFPDAKTAAMLREKGKTAWKLEGNSSNDLFRQLVASGHLKDERILYARTAFTQKPDGQMTPPEKALAAGEVGFGYVMNGNTGFDTKGDPTRPLAVAPLAFDGKTVSSRIFDVRPFDHKAVLLRSDNSATSLPILKKTKEAMLGRGKSLLETGPDTVWGDGITPIIATPLPKR
jgi:hypothetical protein